VTVRAGAPRWHPSHAVHGHVPKLAAPEKRQKHGSDVRRWAKAMEKAVKKGGDATIHAIEKMMREYKTMLDDERDM
jgi:hypothetical protein